MSLFKCKMCGAPLQVAPGITVIECEYCATKQTLPKLGDEMREKLYDRANHLRRSNDFDKAIEIYEKLLLEDDTDAEAYWSLVLCRFGIEYVEDPVSHKHIPTVNRTQYTSIFDDDNYRSALQYADAYQRILYEAEAKVINEIQKGILAISQKEDPFDIFICYKESDSQGRRTCDSVLAQELYYLLKQEGFKVFFSRITLEDHLGSAYEPYIFAALGSAKVMVVLGTRPEYFNAVWVKNEWSRYLALIRQDNKKVLIPAYRDMDPYDLPVEFSHLQAQDMSKLGFMQDLIRGIKKIIEMNQSKPAPAPVAAPVTVTAPASNPAPLLKRAYMFLEDEDWEMADSYCEKVLDMDPENAQAYVCKLLVEMHLTSSEQLKEQEQPFDNRSYYKKAVRFADAKLKATLTGYIDHILARKQIARAEHIFHEAMISYHAASTYAEYTEVAEIFESIPEHESALDMAKKCRHYAELARADEIQQKQQRKNAQHEKMEGIYTRAVDMMSRATTEKDYWDAATLLGSIREYRDADELRKQCLAEFEVAKKNAVLLAAKESMNLHTLASYDEALKMLQSIKGWKDADACALLCEQHMDSIMEMVFPFILNIPRRSCKRNAQWAVKIAMENIFFSRLSTF